MHIKFRWHLHGRDIACWDESSKTLLRQLNHSLKSTLRPHIPRNCRHFKKHGGIKAAMRYLTRNLDNAQFVARFDIRKYYLSMRHAIILQQLQQYKVAAQDIEHVKSYLQCQHSHVGILAGGSIAPVLGALYLKPLDDVMVALKKQQRIIGYERYMDDIVILAKTRWQLRRAIRQMYQVLKKLHLSVHQKTKRFIGKVQHGFDFLGYRLHQGRKLRPSPESLRRLRERARRLYEQGASFKRLWQYVMRWRSWIEGGLKGMVCQQGGVQRIYQHIVSYLQGVSVLC